MIPHLAIYTLETHIHMSAEFGGFVLPRWDQRSQIRIFKIRQNVSLLSHFSREQPS